MRPVLRLTKLQRPRVLQYFVAALQTVGLLTAADKDAAPASIGANASNITEYLAGEAFLRRPPAILSFLLKPSTLDHFCASLCASLCAALIGDGEAEWDAARRINLVVSADLFIVPLDAAAEWHRFHSLFRKMLRQRLAAGLPAEAVNELHRRAAAWLADHELFDDALHHALRANDYDLMAELIGRALPAVSKREGRLTLERWLSYVPETYAASRPELLVLKAWTLHFMYLAEGKLEQVRQAAHDLLRLAEGSNLPTLQSWAHDFLGRMHYQWNELDVAERHLSAILDKRHTAVSIIVGEGLYCLAELYHHQGNDAGAAQIVELLGELDLEHCAREDETTRALRARLQLLCGDVQRAARWAADYAAPVPDRPLVWQHTPHRIKAQILLATGKGDDLQSARGLLDTLGEIAERTHNRRAQIELLATRALAMRLGGEESAAEAALRRAVEPARPGGFVRVFVERGQPMQELLSRLAAQGVAARHLLNGFPGRRPDGATVTYAMAARRARQAATLPAAPAVEPLTAREVEARALLSGPLSNKEIAGKLNVPDATVRRHTITMYGKLGVNICWDAVARAEALGRLPAPG